MKYFLVLVVLNLNNFALAKDCDEVIKEMEQFNNKIKSALLSSTNAEDEALSTIFNKQVKGPHVVKIAQENQKKLLNIILPNRKKIDDSIVVGLDGYISQLKNCKKKVSDCDGSTKNNPRNSLKNLNESADQISDKITPTKTIPR